jgi:hypothetical protein
MGTTSHRRLRRLPVGPKIRVAIEYNPPQVASSGLASPQVAYQLNGGRPGGIVRICRIFVLRDWPQLLKIYG